MSSNKSFVYAIEPFPLYDTYCFADDTFLLPLPVRVLPGSGLCVGVTWLLCISPYRVVTVLTLFQSKYLHFIGVSWL